MCSASGPEGGSRSIWVSRVADAATRTPRAAVHLLVIPRAHTGQSTTSVLPFVLSVWSVWRIGLLTVIADSVRNLTPAHLPLSTSLASSTRTRSPGDQCVYRACTQDILTRQSSACRPAATNLPYPSLTSPTRSSSPASTYPPFRLYRTCTYTSLSCRIHSSDGSSILLPTPHRLTGATQSSRTEAIYESEVGETEVDGRKKGGVKGGAGLLPLSRRWGSWREVGQ